MKTCKICNKSFKRIGPHVYQKHNMLNKEYYDLYELKNKENYCEWCGSPTDFININKGYKRFCCPVCRGKGLQKEIQKTKQERYGDSKYMNREKSAQTMRNKTQEEKDKIWKRKQNTWKKKYNVDHPMKSDLCVENYHKKLELLYGDPNFNNIDKMKETKKEKYGDPNFNNIDKMKETNKKRYKVEYLFQSEEYKKQVKLIKEKKYGDPNFNNIDKIKETCQEKWGVDNPYQAEEIKEKIKQTNLERYGVDHHSQCPEIYEKIIGFKNSWHDYQLPSGKWIKLQGYEPKALDELLEKYNEEDILYKKSDMPEIWYITPKDNKKHRYYPDFYIPKDNLIVEVKSNFTYEYQKEINELKRKATENNYNFKLMIL